MNREIAVEILQMTGAEVETAENGKIAVEKVEASPKGCMILFLWISKCLS